MREWEYIPPIKRTYLGLLYLLLKVLCYSFNTLTKHRKWYNASNDKYVSQMYLWISKKEAHYILFFLLMIILVKFYFNKKQTFSRRARLLLWLGKSFAYRQRYCSSELRFHLVGTNLFVFY